MKIAHIVNPFRREESSFARTVQRITFETMDLARQACPEGVEVTLFSAQYGEDRDCVPHHLLLTEDLDRSILDVGTFRVPRKLPLLRDILDRLHQNSDADFFIFTNTDIALQPYFYSAVARIAGRGYDAFVINRRTLPDTFRSLDQLPLMYSHIGEPHRGYDCFVYRRRDYARFDLGEVCVGTAWVGRALLANMAARTDKFKEFRHEHLTFHIGDDCPWRSPELADYLEYNLGQYRALFKRLVERRGPFPPAWHSYLVDGGQKRIYPDFP